MARENPLRSPLFPMKGKPMRSFFFWLTLAAAVGAILAITLHPGAPEILIVFAVANALYYGLTGSYRRKSSSASA